MDVLLHSCCPGILHGTLHHIAIQIISLYVHLHIVVYEIMSLIHRIVPYLLVTDLGPLLGRELPVHSRCDVCAYHGSLYRKCSTSAERIYKDSVPVPRREHDQRGRQRLRYRSLSNQLSVSPLVK